MVLKKYKNILFDFDGTLFDTGEGIINAVKYTIDKLKLKSIDKETIKRFVGPPLVESFMNVYGFDKEYATLCAKTFREYYSQKGLFECSPYNGIKNALLELKDNGYLLFIATSKPTVFAKDILVRNNMDNIFVDVIGSNLDNSRSKKAEIIECVIDNYHLNKIETIMIGDKSNDIVGANNNSIDSVGVLYGYGDYQELAKEKATYIVDDIVALRNLFINN